MVKTYQVAIVGAGPLGIELAIALKQAGISYIQFDKGQVAEAIYRFPVGTQFFSSSERIGVAGMPIQTNDQQKCTREQYLAYMRATCMKYQLAINSYEDVKSIRRDGVFHISTKSPLGDKEYRAGYVVLATGGTSYPRLLGIVGEQLPHVQIKLQDPHVYFGRHLLIIGGKNSAVEGAVRAFHAGARVTLVTRGKLFDSKTVKYWLLPELMGRIKRNEIACYYQTEVKEIHAGFAILSNGEKLRADFVVKAIGFNADMHLFRQLGVSLGTPIIERIPLAALVGVMFMVVIGTFAWSSLRIINKIPRADAVVIILVSALTVIFDLAIAVMVGVVISALIYSWDSATHITATTEKKETGEKVYHLHGPLFFGAISSFRTLFDVKSDPKHIVINFLHCRVWDHSALEALTRLSQRYHEQEKTVQYVGLSHNCARLLERLGGSIKHG